MTVNRIGPLRRECGFNQKELGEKLGVGQTTVSAWELGKNEPDTQSLYKMSQLFGASIGYIMGYEHGGNTRGLSQEDIRKRMEASEIKKEMDLLFEERESERNGGLSKEEIDELDNDQLIDKWESSSKDTYLEAFQFNSMCDYLTKDQRLRALTVLKAMFPNATNGLYTDEVPHK